jgi:hypothetical protein
LGDDHFLLLPTLQVGWTRPHAAVVATIGWGKTLSGSHNHPDNTDPNSEDHDHDAHGQDDHHGATTPPETSIVNPHAESEFLARVDAFGRWERKHHSLRLGVRADAIQEISSGEGADQVLNLGPVLTLFGVAFTTEMYGLLPIGSSGRYTFRTGLRIQGRLP